MFKRVAHVCLGATDLQASERFYTDVLGMTKKFDFMRGDEQIGFYMDVGDTTFIEVFAQDHESNYDRPIIRHLCLEVGDIDALIEAVRARNWEISDKKMGADHTWQCWIKDPSGVDIEIQQYTDESTQYTGENCIVDW